MSIYLMEAGNHIQQGTPLCSGIHTIPIFNQGALIMAIRKDQNGETNFSEFLQAIWDAGVIGYEVNLIARTYS
ncbi:MAG: hypothetical protein EKK57_03390 [Proteobacteria bacterium]|nr:MAG: hypothetical protein EKK57_03390 [Pseudomonadota bacterium]